MKSSALLQQQLKAAGFQVTAGVVGIPTAFVATFGSGKPVIGIVGEFDALPGLSQEAQTPSHHAIEDIRPATAAGTTCSAPDRSPPLSRSRSGSPRVIAARCATTARRRKKADRARST